MKVETLRKFISSAVGIFALIGCAEPGAASPGYTGTTVYLRSGPSVDYPPVAKLYPGAPVDIIGCLDAWSWCDVSWEGNRGWVSANFLNTVYGRQRVGVVDYGPQIGVPTVVFEERPYWERHYRGRDFYMNHRWHDEHRVYERHDDDGWRYDHGWHRDNDWRYDNDRHWHYNQ